MNSYKISLINGFLSISLVSIASICSFSQSPKSKGTVKGRIETLDHVPAESVSIFVKEINSGTSTDEDGKYELVVPAGNYTLVVSIIGFSSQSKAITVKSNEVVIEDFTLSESALQLQEVVIRGVRAITGMGYLANSSDNVIYTGKKTEVLLIDSLDANTAQNNPRQVLGRVPGANYSETEGSGFPSNGIAFRGLNPTQSIETNTRQNGYNITADLYGYPESYYLPPLEAVERIEVTRGASSLQFGPQFGGVINYILKKGPTTKPIELNLQQTAGSFGLYNSFLSAGGQLGKFNYYAFAQYQQTDGWRPNSDYKKITAYGKLSYQASKKLTVGVEYSLLRNRVHMPGGFTDSLFYADSRASYRTRNWLTSPWNIFTTTLDWKISPNTSLNIKSSVNSSARDLVWRNEDGGPAAKDEIDPITNQYVNRESQHEGFTSVTTEARLLSHFQLGNMRNTLAAGVRHFSGSMKRQGGGEGTTGSDFDFTLVTPGYEYDLDFTTTNFAPYIENTFNLSERVAITPGLRFEYIKSSIKGFNPNEDKTSIVFSDQSRERNILLAGVGFQYKTSHSTNFYANWSQAYRPIDYSSLRPLGTIATVDPNLKDSKGSNTDIGFRGSIRNYLNFDVGGFYLQYNDRIGIIEKTDASGNVFPFRTNVANSIHQGLETYIEFNPIRAFTTHSKWSVSIFNSLALIDARYASGDFKDKFVEYAPKSIHRIGINASIKKISTTLLVSNTAQSFGDASNTITPSADAVAGLIPSYTVLDWSSTWHIKNYHLKLGVNNLADQRYFTKRTDEYPGPGIIPSIGRSAYISIGAKF
jgi:Fe(3+) dicitrate transport protein